MLNKGDSEVNSVTQFSVELLFRSPVRLGVAGLDDQSTSLTIPADRLFSWLALGWIRLYGADDFMNEVVSDFNAGNPTFVLSDGFPVQNGEPFVPIPTWFNSVQVGKQNSNNTQVDTKKNRGKWMDLQSFIAQLRGVAAASDQTLSQPVRSALLQSVCIKRGFGENSEPYLTGAVVPADESISRSIEYKMFLELRKPSIKSKLSTALEFLREEGLGGNRSSGLGALESVRLVELAKPIARTVPSPSVFALLSPCIPTDSMLSSITNSDAGCNNYVLGRRSGWIYDETGRATDFRKPLVSLFESGSLFTVRPEGRLADISVGANTCYRYGIPFVLEG